MSQTSTEISKFLSYALRHQPEAVGLSLDKEGWVVISDLILCSVKTGYALDETLLHQIVDSSDKKRFTMPEDGLRIRAAQGHSTQQVSIDYPEKTPPAYLYHGTATRFMPAIREQGLIPLSRQYVHLSSDKATATQVGQRHGKPIVLKIQSQTMSEQRFRFFQADNGVLLTASVPYRFVSE
nr:RNA 2'-phosphotransferase [uncultured Erwinia sp.]